MQDYYLLEFDERMALLYQRHYFLQYPNRRKNPLDWLPKTKMGGAPSLNRILNVSSRIIQNQREQAFKDYAQFVVNYNGYSDLNLERCVMVVEQINPTLSNSDCDNIYIKPILDGMTEENMIVDDNYKIVSPIMYDMKYEKGVNKTRIFVFPYCDTNKAIQYFNDIKELLK